MFVYTERTGTHLLVNPGVKGGREGMWGGEIGEMEGEGRGERERGGAMFHNMAILQLCFDVQQTFNNNTFTMIEGKPLGSLYRPHDLHVYVYTWVS